MLEGNQKTTVVQLEGGFSLSESFNPVSILQEFISKSGMNGYFFNLPIYAASVKAHETLSSHMILDPMISKWKEVNLALAAVGAAGDESIYLKAGMLQKDEMKDLISKGAVRNNFV